MLNIIQMEDFQDIEWANDWNTIVELFNVIKKLKELFNCLDVPYLREVEQRILILNLEKYVCSLQNYIIEKYS
ncbi:MAG: hypothetical protein KAV01_08795 [Candidatus Lokiarchaeota archaeon]|nr:hypothetical protein [Candidatus Lokiarchaeota archaeon]MCK4480611.1 hypothetical protein [Candidatus Lokiarchaeota archaeon]